jgi:ABC-type multidrug transport system fused ATPase/permease subunit
VREVSQILVVRDGQIIERGTHQALIDMNGGEYRRLFDLGQSQ